jgi:hypothetical protein
MKLTWGKAIFLVMTVFVLLMASFMYRAAFNQEELVAEDYYAQELRYQEEIDKLNRAAALDGRVQLVLNGSSLQIEWPQTVRGKAIVGELYLQRPSDARADARFPVKPDTSGVATVDMGDRLKGKYNAVLEWSADGTTYLTKEQMYFQ